MDFKYRLIKCIIDKVGDVVGATPEGMHTLECIVLELVGQNS